MANQEHASGTNSGATGLVRQLGLGDCISIIMGIMIGSGIFLMAGSIALQLDSLTAVISVWTFGGLLSLAGALSLSELGAAFPSAGGLYVYLNEAYGAATGFLYGWSAILIYAGSIAALAAAVGFYVAPYLNLTPHGQKLAQLLAIALFTSVNCLGVAFGKYVQNGLTILKIGGLVLMTSLLYSHGSVRLLSAHLWPAMKETHFTAFGIALVAVLWAYDGWHMISFTAGEIRDPGRILPRSLVIGTLLTTVIYLFTNVAYYAVLPGHAIRGVNRVAAIAVETAFGHGAAVFIGILIVIAILGTMNGVIFTAPRVNLAMAQDGLFFRSFAKVSPRFHSPVIAIIAQGLLASLFTLAGTFEQLFTSYVFASWVFYGLSVAAVLVLRRSQPDLPRPFRCPWYPVTPIFFLLATGGVILSETIANFRQIAVGAGLILLGWPLYFIFRNIERGRNQRTLAGTK